MKTHPLNRAAFGLAFTLSVAAVAKADFFQAPYGPGGTWRVYERVFDANKTFKDAQADAQARVDPATGTTPGNLISIISEPKLRFVQRTLNQVGGEVWIGLTDREGVAPGAFESQGEPDNRTAGWAWTNGDTYSYSNWGAGEPNDAGGEDAVHFNGGGWNDNKSGYSVDDPISPTVKPGTSSEEATALTYRYIIEYSTDSATPFPGIRRGSVFPPDSELPIPLNTAGNWSLREVRDLTMAGNIIDAMDQALAGLGTITEAQAPYLDYTDPDTNANGGPTLQTAPLPFLSNTAGGGEGDQNILSMAHTRIIIPSAGSYTIQVRSDDGFALRVKGQTWTAISGDGYIDPLDPSTLVFERGTGDSNTRGVLTLAAGQYDLDFVNWEGGGGAFYEVTSATGSQLNAGEAQWLPLGSSASIPGINTLNTVRLAAAANVTNANVRDRGNVLPAMRNIIEKAIVDSTATTGFKPNLEIGEGDMPNNNGGDNYITKVEGSFTVDADANGNATSGEIIDITFGLYCDDGASMRIIGQDFAAAMGDGTTTLLDNGGDMTLTADFYTGNTNARGRIALREGNTYSFVCYMYEGGGGSNFNLRWQLGDNLGGLGSPTALRTPAISDDALNLNSDALVTNSSNAFPSPFLPQTRAILADAIAQGVVQTGTTSLLLLKEGAAAAGTGSITGAAYSGTPTVMPVGGVDNYITKVNGQIIVDNQNGTPGETITLTFGVFADDGADLRIVGQDFLSITDNSGDGTATLQDINGDMSLVADYYTGNTNALGTIDLVEGTYNFEGYHYEGGGGSGYEVWYAVGAFTAFDSAVFRNINTNPGLFLPANTGIQLAAGVPPTGAPVVTAFSFNPGTGAYSVTFTSSAGSTYELDYTNGMQAGAPGTAARWNMVPGAGAIAGAAGTTTVTGNVSSLVTPTGVLPNTANVFFRVKRL